MKLAIIDIIGIPYDGSTVFKQGLGGSESAVTYISKELAKLNFEVTVFNNCNLDHATPGQYDGVNYLPLSALSNDYDFDIVISSRTVIPFLTNNQFQQVGDSRALPFASKNIYERILSKAKQRILWMHDTFCLGDNFIEELTTSNKITTIFTLSDWHLTYVLNCHHGRRRNFEVLKNKTFITRNGAHLHKQEVDIKAKDPNRFVYNASVTKGMIPLVKDIWPRVKQQLPEAKLTVIGGYYRFTVNGQPDQQELDWRQMANDPANAQLDIEFTGIIPQSEIADRLAAANFMIYPAAFPETFGISTLESICYNTPVITCRFGALEEVALEGSCYLIDYAIEPNSLFTDINREAQIKKFVEQTVQAYHNTYLHQQKQYYCNVVKPIAGWDTVALQWKQFFYKTCGLYLSLEEYRQVSKINRRVHKVYNRRYHNVVELENYKSNTEQQINIVSTFYNNRNYIERCIESVICQDYDNYHHYLIDDASTDDTVDVAYRFIDSLPQHIQNKITLIVNEQNLGAVRNQVELFRTLEQNSIIMILDGDDSLINDNTILSYYNTLYSDNLEFTYGSCWSMVDNIPLISQPYPEEVKQSKTYRQHHFNWILPYTHLRTFKKYLIDNCDDSLFQNENNEWYRAGGDGAVFYALIEQADPNKVACLQDIVYNYNDTNPLNDYKVNAEEQNRTARNIISKPTMLKKKILIAIPTARNIEPETFKSIYDQIIPEDYQTTFQYFYGYRVDQVRNLIADWAVKGYDYLWAVDADMAFAPDTLQKLLSHNKDVVTGIYRQRKPEQILEVYENNNTGGVNHIPYYKIQNRGVVEIAACGFGCVLVKSEVFRSIGYPQFMYYPALDHSHTISEDIDFCRKAKDKGFTIWADTSIVCSHIGQTHFNITPEVAPIPKITDYTDRLRELGSQRLIPYQHVEYLKTLSIEPKVVYDIGACVLHWTNEARRIWPDSEYVVFEAMPECEFIYKEQNLQYHIGVLSDTTGRQVDFYQNTYHPGGNSYYRENIEVNAEAHEYFNDSHRRQYTTVTLDAVVNLKKLPKPDLIKMDVQGAELDVLKGAQETLSNCNHVILECQSVEYNKGAPLKDEVITYMESLGFENLGQFCTNGPDGDYYFRKKQ
jgi:FkbM family methyltransferase